MSFTPFAALPTSGQLAARNVYVDSYGADPAGVADSTGAFQAAQTALGTATGNLILSAGTYKLGASGDLGIFGPGQGMTGQGSSSTNISYSGNSTCIQVFESTFNDAHVGGQFGGFTLDGASGGTSAVGFSWGNLQRAYCRDITIESFAGGGLMFANVGTAWSEEAWWQHISLVQNGATSGWNVLFDHQSFDYSIYEFLIVANSGQDGVRMQNGCVLAGCRLDVRGNFTSGVGNTAAVIAIDRATPGGTAQLYGGQVYVNVECDGGTGTGHFTLLMGGSSSGRFEGTGFLNFYNNAGTFQGASIVSSPGPSFGFSGNVRDSVLGTITPGDALIVQGGSQWNTWGSLTAGLFSGAVLPHKADINATQLASGSNSMSISDGPDVRSRKIELFIAQPASGVAGTVTWAANIAWAAGTAPTLSTANSAVDWLRFTYLHSAGKWYGELVAKGLA